MKAQDTEQDLQIPWVNRDGAATVLGVQAAIGAFTALLLGVLQIWGTKIRRWQGPIKRNENEDVVVAQIVEK